MTVSRSTRMVYPADDAVIEKFFSNNVGRSESLRNLIYLFAVEHGPTANVSDVFHKIVGDILVTQSTTINKE